MKREYLFITITLSSFLAASCKSRNSEPTTYMSIEKCYHINLKSATLMTGWYYVDEVDSRFVRQLEKTDELYQINPIPIVTTEDMVALDIQKNNFGETYLLVEFGKRGTELWREATAKSVGKNLALIVNNKLVCAPYVNSEITSGASALGRTDYSNEELEEIKTAIENDRINIHKGKN